MRQLIVVLATILAILPPSVPVAAQEPQGFGPGTFLVGSDIAPGTYRSVNNGAGCYWERLSGLGGSLSEIIANDNASGPAVVTIGPTDRAFSSSGCAPWSQDLSPLRADPGLPFDNGQWIVNTDIAPGVWRSNSPRCYWARLRGFSGQLGDIIANDNAAGSAIVQIAATDVGFESRGCGSWTKVG